MSLGSLTFVCIQANRHTFCYIYFKLILDWCSHWRVTQAKVLFELLISIFPVQLFHNLSHVLMKKPEGN